MTHPHRTHLDSPARILPAVLAAALAAGTLPAEAEEDWSTVPLIAHNTYQAVNLDGTSAFDDTSFPVRLRGVVLNNSEEWLNPAADYDNYQYSGESPLTDEDKQHLFQLGGEAEIFVQAVNLDGTPWDPDTSNPFDDFSGTAAWMGQNYGNHTWRMDPAYSYTDGQWHDELERLDLWYDSDHDSLPNNADPVVRAGDLVELRAPGGLNYEGKMNVNEQHNNASGFDFEIAVLQHGYGLPEPAPLSLAELLDPGFDETRRSGGEHYQSTLITLEDVSVVEGSWDAEQRRLTVTDGEGREMDVDFGWNVPAPSTTGPMELTGILNQGGSNTGGYYLVVVPEPASLLLLGVALCFGLARRRQKCRLTLGQTK